jgi:peptide/nickel transport system permease protein
VLDALLAGPRESREKTYSVPLGTHQYSKESMLVDGKSTRDFPRLQFGGAHLKDEGGAAGDIALRIGMGLLAAAVFAASLGLLARRLKRRIPGVPWLAAGVTLALVLAVAFPVAFLAQHYHVFGTDKVGRTSSARRSSPSASASSSEPSPRWCCCRSASLGIMAELLQGWVDDVIGVHHAQFDPGRTPHRRRGARPESSSTAPTVSDHRAARGLFAHSSSVRHPRAHQLDRPRACCAASLSSRSSVHQAAPRSACAFGVLAILPNVAHIVIIATVMDFSGCVLAEAVLSYVGVGVDPATTSFGTMINAARLEMGREPIVWWSLAAAFVFMFALVLAANLFADAVRDGFDPRVRMGLVPA